MKRFLVSLIVALPLAFGVIAFTAPSTTQTGPPVPGPTNLYCDKKPSNFSVPEVVCPSDGYYTVDIVCVSACDDTYRAKMVEIYNSACRQYDDADMDYRLCTRLAIHAYDACFAASTTLVELEACRDTLTSGMETCAATRASVRAGIAANVGAGSSAAASAFQECAAKCCKKVGELGGDSNGGKIGGQGVRHED